ncbi:MAG: site-specific integrase [Prevotella sp.]|nr:site-specific integrase [Prevotella sp.]
MIVITEEQFQRRTVYYRKEVDGNGRVVKCDRFDCVTRIERIEGKDTVFIADKYGIIRPDVYEYINHTRRGKSINTRLQMGLALQLYCTFCDIYGYDYKRITAFAADKFKRFLQGIDVKAEIGSNVSIRTVGTVKSYKGMIRKFLEACHYSTEGFEPGETVITHEPTAGGGIQPVIRNSGDSDLRSGRLDKLTAPKHFDPKQAKALAASMRVREDWMMLCIFRLGYGYGLRRGEILGLTINDLEQKVDKDTGEMQYKLYLRNRLSDRPDQNAKTLRHPFEAGHYDATDFRKSFFEIDIDESMYNLIMKVYSDSRDVEKLGITTYQKIRAVSKADDYNSKDNYYIFVFQGTKGWDVLSGQTLNNHLRRYFTESGLDLGNVSHAMRHSFAMFHAHYSNNKLDAEMLRRLMRHSSPSSTAVYFNMPRKALKELRERYSIELNELIPEFK